jgi:hypothetical protein
LIVVSKLQGAAEKIKRGNDVHLRQLAKESTHVPSSFYLLFSTFLGAWETFFRGEGAPKEKKMKRGYIWQMANKSKTP